MVPEGSRPLWERGMVGEMRASVKWMVNGALNNGGLAGREGKGGCSGQKSNHGELY